MAELLYQGHGSYRITSESGFVVYIDPYAGEGYDLPGDLILVTHEHSDHNKVSLVKRKSGCRVIRAADAQIGGKYQTFTIGRVTVEATEAYNNHHKKEDCVGFILSLDAVTLYAAGDTSKTEQMESFAERKLDWAVLPIDGVYNMGPAEASECAKIIGAAHTVPIHMMPGKLFDLKMAQDFKTPGRVILRPGETVKL